MEIGDTFTTVEGNFLFEYEVIEISENGKEIKVVVADSWLLNGALGNC